jgi:hypothetical protein
MPAIYVDALMNHGWKLYGHPVRNCHLFTDGSLELLHDFAVKRLGMKRIWFQDGRIPHYDLTPPRRHLAVMCGAVEVDRRQAVEIWARIQRAGQGARPTILELHEIHSHG